MDFSPDQSRILRALQAHLARAGLAPDGDRGGSVQGAGILAVLGRAGTGKTAVLAHLVAGLVAAGIPAVNPDATGRRAGRSFAVLAPTNKAASVLRARGVPATTLHRILYTPVYDPALERIAAWLEGRAERPDPGPLSDAQLDRAHVAHARHGSIPAALAAAGVQGASFIRGWTRRAQPLDLGLVDEASMLDARQLDDLKALFPTLILFGDPAQLAPVGEGGGMVFDRLPADARLELKAIHRQASDSPITRLAAALADPGVAFEEFERLVAESAARDPRIVVAGQVDAGAMARTPVLVWRNQTRVRLIGAFRAAHGVPEGALVAGEPLVCDGIELPPKLRHRRYELEARGLIKGSQAIYLGPGRKPGFARVHVVGSDVPGVSVAAIVALEAPDREEPVLAVAARQGVRFLHGAAVTIHKAQGSQWPMVQVFAPDLYAAARSGRVEAGIPLWRRLAYVAITRAETRLIWVTRWRLRRPAAALSVADLRAGQAAPAIPEAAPPPQS